MLINLLALQGDRPPLSHSGRDVRSANFSRNVIRNARSTHTLSRSLFLYRPAHVKPAQESNTHTPGRARPLHNPLLDAAAARDAQFNGNDVVRE